MRIRNCALIAGLLASTMTATLRGAEKPIEPAEAGDESVDLTATALADRKAVSSLLGHDPGFDLIVIQIKVAPRGEDKMAVWRDDFTLISRRDGQKSQPLAPGQIAGKGALVISQSGGGGHSGFGTGNDRGGIWPGDPTSGRPRRIGGDGDMIGGAGGPASEAKATMQSEGKDNPLLAVLKERILPEKETVEPVEGLLYFLLEGKHKLKDLELMYRTGRARLILDFQR